MGFFRKTDDDDPGTIETIERAQAAAVRAALKKKKNPTRPPALRDIPRLTKELLMQNSKSTTLKEAQEKAIEAAKKLYDLCDVGHKANREVMVASGQYDVIGPLTQALLHEPIYYKSDALGKSSPSNVMKLPHQEPRMEGDSISDNSSIKTGVTNSQKDPSTEPIPPSDETNGEVNSDNGGEESSIIIENTSTPAAKPKTPSPKKKTVRRQQHRVDEKLHFVCLALNNLSIPQDNKRVMVGERGARQMIKNLCKVIASGKKESHLCCIILMNLTFYEPALTIIGQFSPTPKHAPIIDNHNGKAQKALKTTTTMIKRAADAVTKQRKLTPLENPQSLLRVLQDLISSVERGTSDFRWAFGLLANLSRHPENALLIGLTGIPRVAIANLRLSKIPSNQWATNSLEDFSLYFLLHMAEASPQGLQGALEVVVPIMNGVDQKASNAASGGKNATTESAITDKDNDGTGIQSLKATMICAFLGLKWKDFPDHGVIAAGTVSELMGNTFERVGKKQVYTDNDFALRTAVSAYAALAKAAAKADSSNTSLSSALGSVATPTSTNSTKIMALPTSVALLFQIVNAIALHWGEDNNKISSNSGHGKSSGGGGNFESYADAYHWDIKAGDLAVGAIMSLLPALLEGTGEVTNHPSTATMLACADLSKIFIFFSKKTNSISVRARSAEVAEKLTESAAGSALPLLEASYDLCRNFGTHKLQKNFL